MVDDAEGHSGRFFWQGPQRPSWHWIDTFPIKGRLNAGFGIQEMILKHNSRMRLRHL
jgi:hypothetical protein